MDFKPKNPLETAHGGKFTWNDDVLAEILLRLPAKSLTRFKSVCKRWLSQISGHHFCLLHTLHSHKPQPSLLLRTRLGHFFYFHPVGPGSEKLIPYQFYSFSQPKIISSCNGLLLLQHDLPEKCYSVYNPTTKKSRKIVLSDDHGTYTYILSLQLTFDPSKSPTYKIVCVRAKEQPFVTKRHLIELYSSETHNWKKSMEFENQKFVYFSRGIHFNNVICWRCAYPDDSYFNIDQNLVSDLPHVQFPWPQAEGGICHLHYQESNGCLNQFFLLSHQGEYSIGVHELQEDYSEWKLKYHVGIGRAPEEFYIMSFVSGDDGNEETSTLVCNGMSKLMTYSFLEKRFKELVDLKKEPFYQEGVVQFDHHDVHQFGETLAPV